MDENLKYLYLIVLTIVGIGILPNLILRFLTFELFAPFTVLLNSFIIPILLLIIIAMINEKFGKDWWILNFVLISGVICLSVYLGFLNWAHWADKTPGGWGSNNVDKGTKMILNLELQIGLGIVGIVFLFKILSKIGKWIGKSKIENE